MTLSGSSAIFWGSLLLVLLETFTVGLRAAVSAGLNRFVVDEDEPPLCNRGIIKYKQISSGAAKVNEAR